MKGEAQPKKKKRQNEKAAQSGSLFLFAGREIKRDAMKIHIYAICAAVLILLSLPSTCLAQDAPPRDGKVTKEYDRFKDSTTVTLDALLAGDYPQGLSVRAIEIFPGTSPTKESSKYIFAFLSTGEDLEYELLHDLIFLADGERLKVDNSSYMKQFVRGNYLELILIAIPSQTLRKVASATKAEAQIGKTEFVVSGQLKENLKRFLAEVEPAVKAPQPDRPDVAQELLTYLRSGFGMPGYETTWYGAIKTISVKGSAVEVKTDSSTIDYNAKSICGVVSGFVYSNRNRSLGLDTVRVYGDSNQLLISREKLSDPCG
jgi:hypothetical protein